MGTGADGGPVNDSDHLSLALNLSFYLGSERSGSRNGAVSFQRFDVAVPKNIQRNWSSRERGRGEEPGSHWRELHFNCYSFWSSRPAATSSVDSEYG